MFTLIWKENGSLWQNTAIESYRKTSNSPGNKSPNKKQYKPLLKDPLLKVDHIT